MEADVLARQEGCNAVGGEERVQLASEVVGPISTMLGDFRAHSTTKLLYKEGKKIW